MKAYNHHVCCSGDMSKPRNERGCACFSICRNMKINFWPASWENEETSVFLGTERNPSSKMIYDYWIVNNGIDASWTCKYGEEDCEYGSSSISHLGTGDFAPHMLKMSDKDFIFGITRAKYFALLYLATGRKPLLCQ